MMKILYSSLCPSNLTFVALCPNSVSCNCRENTVTIAPMKISSNLIVSVTVLLRNVFRVLKSYYIDRNNNMSNL